MSLVTMRRPSYPADGRNARSGRRAAAGRRPAAGRCGPFRGSFRAGWWRRG